MPTDPVTCLECHRHLAIRRGLCSTCYPRLCQLVRVGGATWAQLEAAGRCKAALVTPWRTRHDGEPDR